MITPIFELKQDSEILTIIIKAPFVKVSETEIFVEDTDFKFYCRPYFLRLTLPGEVCQEDNSSAKYDADTGYFNITLKKKIPNQKFEGLDMLSNLLNPHGKASIERPKIEVIDDEERHDDHDCDFKDIDWQIHQELPLEDESLYSKVKYGFANQRMDVISKLQAHLTDLFDLKDPDSKTLSDIRNERANDENTKFSPDHYLADLFDDENIKHLIAFRPSWLQFSSDSIILTQEEREQLVKLPKRNYILDKFEMQKALFGLVDLILAYAYDARTTEEESTVESVWTIRKLCATLSWIDSYSNLKEVLVCFARRSLSYPLYRSWELSMAVIQDCISIIKLGKTMILRCLLQIHSMLNSSDPHYILNDLYVTDYCIWIQTVSPSIFTDLSDALQENTLTKDDAELDLINIEKTAQDQNSDVNDLNEKVSSMKINSQTLDSDDDSDEETSDSSSDSDSSDSTSSESECDSSTSKHSDNNQSKSNEMEKPIVTD